MDPRVAILNGFGRTLGDSIIGLQALFAARSLGLLARAPVLYRLVMPSPVIEDVYRAAADLAEIRELPWDHATRDTAFPPAAGFAETIDMRDFAFDPAFRGVAMIDYFLARLGVAPCRVPAAWRRNLWLAPRLPELAGLPRADAVLVCPHTANAMRTMPEPVHRHILAWFAANTAARVLTQASLKRADGLAALARQVAGVKLVVSADTAMVHLADALATPCLAFFPTHDPAWRVRDYPLCTGLPLASGLPPALEFPRGPDDIAAARAAWLPHGPEPSWLDPHLAAASRRAGLCGPRP